MVDGTPAEKFVTPNGNLHYIVNCNSQLHIE